MHAVLPGSKNFDARILKKSKVLSLRHKKVCHKWKQYLKYGSQGTGTPRDPLGGRDSRFSRLGTETPRLSVQVLSRNWSRNRKSDIPSLGIGTGTKTQTFQVSESEPESKSQTFQVSVSEPETKFNALKYFLQLQALFDLKQPFF